MNRTALAFFGNATRQLVDRHLPGAPINIIGFPGLGEPDVATLEEFADAYDAVGRHSRWSRLCYALQEDDAMSPQR